MSQILESEEVGKLVTLVEEAARSTEESVKYFVEPAPGTLSRAKNKRHHLIFGRRGSGKSSLLRKAASELTLDRRPIAYVNLEVFKGHSHPDVLISVLISTFREFKDWMQTAAIYPATKKSFWRSLFGSIPRRGSFKRKDAADIVKTIDEIIDELVRVLNQSDEADITQENATEASEVLGAEGTVSGKGPGASAEAKAKAETSESNAARIEERYKRSKIDFLHRRVIEYQRVFNRLGLLSDGDAFLFLDDLYHIRRADQARVVDYFHRVAKDNRLWLKAGTIRHRTTWYIHGDPSIGMKIGDDADEIDLDVTLEKYRIAKDFLRSILNNFAVDAGSDRVSSFITDGAFDRLVLASGGVARDFLSIFRKSIDVARERGGGPRGERVGAEDVNVAAGEYDSSKREEFRRDTSDESETNSLEAVFYKLRDFCLDKNNTNCFLLDKDDIGPEINSIRELVDLKLIHLVRSRVTVSGRPGKIFEAYMLDLSQYAGSRKRRNLDLIEFWRPGADKALRRISLIYSPDAIAL
nr:hypothetical protein [uncultured Halomonas sp.]